MGLSSTSHRGVARRARAALRGVSVLAATALVAGVAGCSSTQGQPDVPAAPATPRVSADIILPFDAYDVTPQVQRVENDAYRELVSRCAAGYGVDLAMPAAEVPVETNARRYGLFDADRARTHGYVGTTVFLDQVRAGEWRPSALQKYVLTGESRPPGAPAVPAGGCARRSEQELGLPDATMADVSAAGRSTFDQAAADPGVRAAEQRWSACLATQGLHYARTFDPSNQPWTQPRGSALELRTATADVRCKQTTNLVGAWLAAEAALQRRVIENDPQAFAALRSWHEARLARARAVLDGAEG